MQNRPAVVSPRLVRCVTALLFSGMTWSNPGLAGERPLPERAARAQTDQASVVALAHRALRDSGIDEAEIRLESVQRATWPDSSLGCPQRGSQYMQVITHGHRVRFKNPRGLLEVHVAGNFAVVCARPGALVNRLRDRQTPLRNIDRLVEQAKKQLSDHIGVDIETIRMTDLVPTDWPDGSLGCPQDAPFAAGKVSGYRIVLTSTGRPYTFHTDGQRVLACPAIADR